MARVILKIRTSASATRAGPRLTAISSAQASALSMGITIASARLSLAGAVNLARSLAARQQTQVETAQTTVTAFQRPKSACATLVGLALGE